MKWALRNKTAEKRLKMANFTYIFLSFIRTILPSSMLCENTRTMFESTDMGMAHFKILIFFRLFKYWGRVGKRLVKCLPSTSSCNFVYAFGPNKNNTEII